MWKSLKENNSLYIWVILGSMFVLGGLLYIFSDNPMYIMMIWSKLSMYTVVFLFLYKGIWAEQEHKHVPQLCNFIICSFVFLGFIFVIEDMNFVMVYLLILVLSFLDDITSIYIDEDFTWKYICVYLLMEAVLIFGFLFLAHYIDVAPIVEIIGLACIFLYKVLQALRLNRKSVMVSGLIFYAVYLVFFAWMIVSHSSLKLFSECLVRGFWFQISVFACELVMLYGFWKVSIRSKENFKTVTFPFYYILSFVYLCLRMVLSGISLCFSGFEIGPLYFDLYFVWLDILATGILFCSIYQGQSKVEQAFHIYKQNAQDSSWIQAGLILGEFYLKNRFYNLAAETFYKCLPVVWKNIEEKDHKYILCQMLVSLRQCVFEEEKFNEVQKEAAKYCELLREEDAAKYDQLIQSLEEANL